MADLNLWDTPSLQPPGSLDKLSLVELNQWQEKLQTAISRHKFLRSPQGQSVIVDQTRERIKQLELEILAFQDWLGNRSEASLKSLEKLAQAASQIYERRSLARQAKKDSEKSQSKKSESVAKRFALDSPEISELLERAGVSRSELLAKLS